MSQRLKRQAVREAANEHLEEQAKGRAVRDAAIAALQADLAAAMRACGRLRHKRGDAACRLRALRADVEAQVAVTYNADRDYSAAIRVAATEDGASRARAALYVCECDLRALVDRLVVAVAAVDLGLAVP